MKELKPKTMNTFKLEKIKEQEEKKMKMKMKILKTEHNYWENKFRGKI